MPGKCLYCYNQTGAYEGNFHIACAKKVLGGYPPPTLPFDSNQLDAIAKQQGRAVAVFNKERKKRGAVQQRLMPNVNAEYIVKTEVARPQYLPQLEHLCLKLAKEAGIKTVENTLLTAADEEQVLLLKIEHLISLSHLSNITNPENGTYEKLIKAIEKHSTQPGLDKLYIAERLVFSFLIGNSNVHWGNVFFTNRVLATLTQSTSTALLQPALANDFSLSIAGKRSGIDEKVMLHFFEKIGINEVAAKNMLRRYSRILRVWFTIIEKSFLNDDMKRRFIRLIISRAERLEML